jgi:hypothetical protein
MQITRQAVPAAANFPIHAKQSKSRAWNGHLNPLVMAVRANFQDKYALIDGAHAVHLGSDR